MSSGERHVRASLGFSGGQVLAVRCSGEALEHLRGALGGDVRFYEVPLEDGAVTVDLSQVAYLRVDSDEPRVGFGA